jgi:hypothetical protein
MAKHGLGVSVAVLSWQYGQRKRNLVRFARSMNADLIILVLGVGTLTAVASLGAWINRYRAVLVVCALIPMMIVSYFAVDCMDAFFSDPVSLWKDDIIEFGPGFAAVALPIYLAGLVSLIRVHRKNKGSLGNDQISTSNS